MSIQKLISFLLLGAALSSCEINIVEEAAPKYNLTVSSDGAFSTKTTFEAEQLIWSADDAIAVMFGNTLSVSSDAAVTQRLGAVSGHPGKFAGEVSPSPFTMDDLLGLIYPYSRVDTTRIHYTDANGLQLRFIIKDVQHQKENNRLNGENVPLYAWTDKSCLVEKGDGTYSLEGVNFKHAAAIVRFNVYGEYPGMERGEILKEVWIADDTQSRPYSAVIQVKTTDGWVYNTGKFFSRIILDQNAGCTIADKTSANGIKLFLGAYPTVASNPAQPKVTRLMVITDKAEYSKEFSTPKELSLIRGQVTSIGLNLANFDSRNTGMGLSYGLDSLVYSGLKVYYYIPYSGDRTSMPILFAMHGADRQGLYQVENWKDAAERNDVMVFAPQFDLEEYSSTEYQLGGVSYSSSTYSKRDSLLWTYNIIESLFDFVKEATGNTRLKYDLWGHSAGSQFAHRMAFYMSKARIDRVVCSNAGFYTMPMLEGYPSGENPFRWPYSLLGTEYNTARVKEYLARNLTVHLGTADLATTKEEDPYFPTSAGSVAQGAHRLARGHFFYEQAESLATAWGVPFNWTLVEVPDIPHSSRRMIQTATYGAAALLYENE